MRQLGDGELPCAKGQLKRFPSQALEYLTLRLPGRKRAKEKAEVQHDEHSPHQSIGNAIPLRWRAEAHTTWALVPEATKEGYW